MERFVIVVTADDNFVFCGFLDTTDLNKEFLQLKNALTVAFMTNGEPVCTFSQIPIGIVDPSKQTTTVIPRSNVAYMLFVDKKDGHNIYKMYEGYFSSLTTNPTN